MIICLKCEQHLLMKLKTCQLRVYQKIRYVANLWHLSCAHNHLSETHTQLETKLIRLVTEMNHLKLLLLKTRLWTISNTQYISKYSI